MGTVHTYFMGWSFIKLIKKGQFVPSQATGRVPPGFYASQRGSIGHQRQNRNNNEQPSKPVAIAAAFMLFGLFAFITYIAIKMIWP